MLCSNITHSCLFFCSGGGVAKKEAGTSSWRSHPGFRFVSEVPTKLPHYQNLITQSMYGKQLDNGKGTFLHLCDDVIHL
ncbi:hypothetical protein VNO77_14711 [Canavalia gladiata]|uniref:Uncharacterized protein n=1 Tax=Canavalia gladiata TaxID=3824 RepID=A0AAN9LYZ2_CANGL